MRVEHRSAQSDCPSLHLTEMGWTMLSDDAGSEPSTDDDGPIDSNDSGGFSFRRSLRVRRPAASEIVYRVILVV